jgi:hypothetical protein
MAITRVKEVATGNVNNASGPGTLTIPGAGVSVGNRLFVYNSCFRPSGSLTSITDTGSNTWVMLREQPGGTSSSSTANVEVWTAQVTTGLVSGNTITLNFTGTQREAYVCEEYSGLDTDNVAVVDTSNGATFATTTPTVTVTPSSGGERLLMAMDGMAGPLGDGFTQDTDTTVVAWTTITRVGTTGGSATSNTVLSGGTKIVPSGTTSQTYNPTLGTARDNQIQGLFLKEASGGAATAIPNLVMAPYRGTR